MSRFLLRYVLFVIICQPLTSYLRSYFLRLHAFINESGANRSTGPAIFQCLDERTYCCDKEICDCNNGTGTISLQDSASIFTVTGIFQTPNTSESKTLTDSFTPSSTKLGTTLIILESSFSSSSSALLIPPVVILSNSSNPIPVASGSQQPRSSSLPYHARHGDRRLNWQSSCRHVSFSHRPTRAMPRLSTDQ